MFPFMLKGGYRARTTERQRELRRVPLLPRPAVRGRHHEAQPGDQEVRQESEEDSGRRFGTGATDHVQVSVAGGNVIEVAAGLDRHAAEALRLEIERLARAKGLALTVTVRPMTPTASTVHQALGARSPPRHAEVAQPRRRAGGEVMGLVTCSRLCGYVRAAELE